MKKVKISDRFDMVYQAWLQTGKTPYYRGDHLALFCKELEGKDPKDVSEHPEKFSHAYNIYNESYSKIQRSPLIKNNQVRLCGVNGEPTLDSEIYTIFQQWDDTKQIKSFSLSKDVVELINNTKISDERFNEIDNEFLSNPEELYNKYSGIYYCNDMPIYETWNCVCLIPPNQMYRSLVEKGQYCIAQAFNSNDISSMPKHQKLYFLEFIIKFYEILYCLKTPLETVSYTKLDNVKRTERIIDNSIRHVTINLSKSYINRRKQAMQSEHKYTLNKDNLMLAPSFIGGYVRNQHYGKKNSETKSIWVDGFIRNQWKVKAVHTRVISKTNNT